MSILQLQLHLISFSHQVRRILEIFQPNKVLLDAPRAYEAIENTDATRLIVRPASTSTTEWLLPDHSPSAFFVVVHVTGSVAELVIGFDQGFAVRGESRKKKRRLSA